MNFNEFYSEVQKLSKSYENIDLEKYLLSVLRIVIEKKNHAFSLELAHKIFKDSFTTKPLVFQSQWLDIKEAPDDNRISRKFTNSEINVSFDKRNESLYSGIEFTIEVLKFQIAELHKMRGKQLENKYRYLGIASETGNYWYNFDPFTILECGTRCIIDNEEKLVELDWSFVGELLENGRIYE